MLEYEQVLKVVVKKQLCGYLENDNNLNNVQSGFRQQHVCIAVISTMVK